jgi:hypothetical protein
MIVAGTLMSVILFRSFLKKKNKAERNLGIVMAALTAPLIVSTIIINA